MVATKASLSIRVDALADADTKSDVAGAEIGISNRVKLESRLRALEHRAGIVSTRTATTGQTSRQNPKFELSGTSAAYNSATDSVMLPTQPAAAAEEDKKDKKKKRKSEVADVDGEGDESMVAGETKEERRARKEAKKAAKAAKKEAEGEGEKEKKSKKRRASEVNGDGEADDGEKKKKKKKRDSEAA
jgi:nucleolar protein 58